jgi:hypothetical protein
MWALWCLRSRSIPPLPAPLRVKQTIMNTFRRFAAIPSVALSFALILSAGSAIAQSQPQESKDSERAKADAQEKGRQDEAAVADKTQASTSKQEKPKQDKAKDDPKNAPKDQRELEEEEDI